MAPPKKEPKAVDNIDEIFGDTVRINATDKHKIEEFQRLGFSFKQANTLARVRHLSSATVRETFIKRGCPPDIAYRIIGPND